MVSVVSGGRPDFVAEFLRSLYSTADDAAYEMRMVAILNHPSAELDRRLRDDASMAARADILEIRTNDEPRGFATNHNSVMRTEAGDYFVIANDDVVVLDDAVGTLVRFMETDAARDVAVASPQLLNPDGTIQRSTRGFPTVWRMLLSISGLRDSPLVARGMQQVGRLVPRYREGRTQFWAHDQRTIVDTVVGAFMVVRASATDEVGLMDEVSLVGGEETEWHRRMREQSWRVAFIPEAHVIHHARQTIGLSRELEVEFVRGWLNYFTKWDSPVRVIVGRAGGALLYGLRWLVYALARDQTGRRLAIRGIRTCLVRIDTTSRGGTRV